MVAIASSHCTNTTHSASNASYAPPKNSVPRSSPQINRRQYILKSAGALLVATEVMQATQPLSANAAARLAMPPQQAPLAPSQNAAQSTDSWDVEQPSAIQARMQRDTVPANPGMAFAVTNKRRQLFYPDWLQGTWSVQGQLAGVGFPLGLKFVSKSTPGVTKASIIAAISDVGAGQQQPVTFLQRWEASKEEGGIVADRVYNITHQVDAFLGQPTVRAVEYEPSKNPTRLSVVYVTPRKDASEVSNDFRKAELFVNNRKGELLGDNTFVCTELYRQVNQAKQQGSVGDYEVLTEYTRATDGKTISVRQRVAAYLQPQDPLYFEADSSAVALYDYRFSMVPVGG